MSQEPKPRVLCIDDDPHILASVRRQLHRAFDVTTVTDGREGLQALRELEPFAVIVADLRMPGMSGIEFFEVARSTAPQAVRILLTGQADLDAAIDAINEGHIFRFLRKPCPPIVLLKAIRAGVEQFELVQSERVLLAETLLGCIRVLSDVLALTNPAAFGRALRIQEYVSEVASDLEVSNRWELEIPALLSQIGCITLPAETVEKLDSGRPLTAEESAMVDELPRVTADILGKIPRLEKVRRILEYQNKRYSGEGPPPDKVRGKEIPFGARVLRVALDYDALELQGLEPADAIEVMKNRSDWYDREVLHAFARRRGQAFPRQRVTEVALHELEPGMVFHEDVRTTKGVFLVPHGQTVTPGIIQRLRNLAPTAGLRRTFVVRVPISNEVPS
ncbi:MAG: HD domain-containing phosphohydrolase [Planctomycetota bacterium]